jgi:hypothetical protein
LRELLEAKDLDGFLKLYEAQGLLLMSQPGAGLCTQRLLPALCSELFARDAVNTETVLLLGRLVRSGQLLIVDNDILKAINLRIEHAFPTGAPQPAESSGLSGSSFKLPLYPQESRAPVSQESTKAQVRTQDTMPMERIVICSSLKVGFLSMSDSFSFKKNLCASSQEREFRKAIRQYFPNLRAYPNLPLRNFIDLDALGGLTNEQMRRFCWSSQVDVLLCTEDEDPVAGIELDSVHHDDVETQDRDAMKDKLFSLAGVPLVRIRSADTLNVRAEDFYDLLLTKSDALDGLRPRQLRPRRNHETLVPVGFKARRTSTGNSYAHY